MSNLAFTLSSRLESLIWFKIWLICSLVDLKSLVHTCTYYFYFCLKIQFHINFAFLILFCILPILEHFPAISKGRLNKKYLFTWLKS